VLEYRDNFPLTVTKRAAQPFGEVQRRVAALLKDKILVGHAVFNDLKACAPLMSPFAFFISCDIPFAGTTVVAPISVDTRYPTACVQIQTFQGPAPSPEKSYGSGIRNTNPRRGAFECPFNFNRTLSAAPHVFTLACRSQMPGPQWRYTVCIDASGTRERAYWYHLPRAHIAWTSPDLRRNGNTPMLKGTSIRPVVGGRG